jgi:hypothetical protein
MTYKITQQVIDLVQALFEAGYSGEATITNLHASGAAEVLGKQFAVSLSGFSKETLQIVEDQETAELVFVGRYSVEHPAPTVEGLIALAWGMYQEYKSRGYSVPDEFEELFKKYGYMVQKTIPAQTVWEEA